MFDLAFLQNFLSNALATFIGVIIGIPVALWINRIQQRASEIAERRKAEVETNGRKRHLLQLIKDELDANKTLLEKIQLDELRGNNEDNYADIQNDEDIVEKLKTFDDLYQLRTELWKAFSDGGELKWIQNLELLQSIALVYESLRMTSYCYELIRYSQSSERGVLSLSGPWSHESTLIYLRLSRSIKTTSSHIDNALVLISKELGSN